MEGDTAPENVTDDDLMSETDTTETPPAQAEADVEVDTPAPPKVASETRDERLARLKEALTKGNDLNPAEPEEAVEEDEEPEETPAPSPKPTTEADPAAIDYVEGASMPKEVWKALPKDAKPAFRAMRDAVLRERHEKSVLETQLKAETADAAYGRELITFARTHKITPEGMQEVLGAAALINAGDPAAVDWLLTYAKKLGYEEPSAPRPKSKLDKLRDDGLISEDDYRELAKDTVPAPIARAPSRLPDIKVPQRAAAPSPDAEIKTAQAKLAEQDAAMAKKYGSDWARVLRPKVDAEMARFKGAPPDQWLKIMDQSVRVVVSELRATKRKIGTDASLPGSAAPVKRSPDPSNLEGRAKVQALARRGAL
jgi:hypothetical protein